MTDGLWKVISPSPSTTVTTSDACWTSEPKRASLRRRWRSASSWRSSAAVSISTSPDMRAITSTNRITVGTTVVKWSRSLAA